MAKLLLLLHGAVDDLLAPLERDLAAEFAAAEDVAVQLLREPAADPFFDPAAPLPRPQVVVDLRVRAGRALADCYDALGRLLQGLPVSAGSLALVMHTREYIPAPPQPVHYHLLMFRRSGTSHADYLDYYTRFHARMGFNTPGIAGYVQNYVDAEASEALAVKLGLATVLPDSISELTFESTEALLPQLAAAEVAKAAPVDEARFIDRSRSLS
ncbi:MAG: hypothetical protein HKN19_12300, partial [Halioglobus sp.]|nr:hypothetical protein [Halioglobus sp.]